MYRTIRSYYTEIEEKGNYPPKAGAARFKIKKRRDPQVTPFFQEMEAARFSAFASFSPSVPAEAGGVVVLGR